MSSIRAWAVTSLLLLSAPLFAQPAPPELAGSGPPPSPVLVVDVTQATPAQHLMAVSLQAIANRARVAGQPARPGAGEPSVFLLTNPRDEEWLAYCLRILRRPVQRVSVSELLERLRGEVKGQVLYDPAKPYTADLATTAAGIREAVISATDLGLPTLYDLRGKWSSAEEAYQWALDNLLPQCQQARGAVIPPDSLAFRDYVMQQRMFTISPPATAGGQAEAPPGRMEATGGTEKSAFRELLFRLMPGGVIYGRPPEAARALPGRYSHSLVSVSDTANLSFLSQIPNPTPLRQYIGYLRPLAPVYLTLIFDCSDLDFAVNQMPAVWDDPVRATMPLGWALPAALAEAAPPVLHRYYADAYRSGLDQFVLGASGAAELDISAAPSPYRFYEATSAAREHLDAHTALFDGSNGTQELDIFVPQLIAEAGVRGVFVIGTPDFPPYLYSGAPVIPAPRVSSLKQAFDYLDWLPPDRSFAALCLDPRSLTPADAAHLAAYLGDRFVIAAPEEMVEAIRNQTADEQQEGVVVISSVQYPQDLQATDPIPIKAKIDDPSTVSSVTVVYHPANHPLAFAEPMERSQEGYAAELPPLLCGGDFDVLIRALDANGRVSSSPPWKLHIPWHDADEDGLTDVEEQFLLTEPSLADTDGDGLTDRNDLNALRFDQMSQCYLGPIEPPSDHPYLLELAGATGAEAPAPPESGRLLRPGESAIYWLPTAEMPPGTPFVLKLEGAGDAAITLSSHSPGEAAPPTVTASFPDAWYSPPLLSDDYPQGLFAHLACSGHPSTAPLTVRGLALLSPPLAPSITDAAVTPAHPGPEQPIYISVQVFTPRDLAEVSISYRMSDQGTVAFPMQLAGRGQRYTARLPAFANRDQIEWWVTARDTQGNQAMTPPALITVGSWARETAALVATREFSGDWTPDTLTIAGREKLARSAAEDGLVDTGPVNLTGGNYAVWLLAGGRGRGIGVYVKEKRIGGIDPQAPDGWQMVGRVHLDAGHYHVQIISEPGPQSSTGASARYAALVLSADPGFKPPAEHLLDAYNSLALLFPPADQVLSGRVELRATGSGNVTSAQFSVDGEALKSAFGPPFTLSLSTTRYQNGSHVLRVQGLDRAGPTGLVLEIPITIAN